MSDQPTNGDNKLTAAVDSLTAKWARTIAAVVGVPMAGAIAMGAWGELQALRQDVTHALYQIGQHEVRLEEHGRRLNAADLRLDRMDLKLDGKLDRR